MSAPLKFEEYLIRKGAKFELHFNEYKQAIARLGVFIFRFEEARIQVGYLKTFDRWANSVDWELFKYPRDDFGFDCLLEALNEDVRLGKVTASRDEPIDPSQSMRKIRKQLKSKMRNDDVGDDDE